MTPEVKIFQIPAGERHAGLWTFAVDGQPSYYYCPDEYSCQRVVDRLKRGQSHSLGGALLAAREPQRVEVAKVTDTISPAATPGGPQPEPVRKKGWVYVLDGVRSETLYEKEHQARISGAFAAFMSRGKLAKK